MKSGSTFLVLDVSDGRKGACWNTVQESAIDFMRHRPGDAAERVVARNTGTLDCVVARREGISQQRVI